MNESAISLFRKLPETKSQVSNYARLIKESVLAGEVDPLLFIAQTKAVELLMKTISSDELIKDTILAEAEKYGKSFEKSNAKFQIKEVGSRFDYSNCNDSQLDEINNKIAELTEKKKERENFLKSIPPTGEVYDDNGIQLLPPIKTSTTQVVITLK